MRTLALAGRGWRTKNDFYDAILTALGAPDWHGRNLDALNDSIGTGSINAVEVPYQINISGLGGMHAEARMIVEQFARLIADLQAEGCAIRLQLSP